MIKLLFIGDVFGSPGRKCLARLLPQLRTRWRPDLVIANGENAAGGMGMSAATTHDLLEAGVDVITTGNHVWKFRDLVPLLREDSRILRPANYPDGAPGRGFGVYRTISGVKVGVVNLEGRVNMSPLDCPYAAMDRLLAEELSELKTVCLDFHAEATSEKQAMGWHLDGRASVVVGTHTHVQTADERILPGGTAYITDLGLTGPHDSVIGMDPKTALKRLRTQVRKDFKVAKRNLRLQGALVSLDPATGRPSDIQRVDEPLD